MKARSIAHGVLVAAALFASHAQASLIGATAKFQYLFPDSSTVYQGEGLGPQTAVVGSGTEFVTPYFRIDVQADQIVYSLTNTAWNPVAHNGPRIVFSGITLSDAHVDMANTSFGGSGLGFSWGADYVDLNWKTYSGRTITIDVASGSNGNRVPEPASVALVAAGLTGIGLVRRRKAAA